MNCEISSPLVSKTTNQTGTSKLVESLPLAESSTAYIYARWKRELTLRIQSAARDMEAEMSDLEEARKQRDEAAAESRRLQRTLEIERSIFEMRYQEHESELSGIQARLIAIEFKLDCQFRQRESGVAETLTYA